MFGYSFEYGHYSMGKMQCKLHFRASFSKNPAICVPGKYGAIYPGQGKIYQ